MYTNILRYRSGRYGWIAVIVFCASWLLYLTQSTSDPPSGSTWQGYVLGTVAAALIVFLLLLGVRKRRYQATGRTQAWVSAHIYLGVVCLAVVLFHSAGQLSFNVHGIVFSLLIIVVVSGILGMYLYLLLPRRLSDNRAGHSRDELFAELKELNQSCIELCTQCGSATEFAVRSSIMGTSIGGGVLDQLFARDHSTFVGADGPDVDAGQTSANKGQRRVLRYIARQAPRVKADEEADALPKLVSFIARRQELLRRLRRDIQLQAWLEIWLYIHVPVSIALLVGVLVHVIIVFLYW